MSSQIKGGEPVSKPWEKFPDLDHFPQGSNLQKQMARRRRLRSVRYWLFRLQNAETGGSPIKPHERGVVTEEFLAHWLGSIPRYWITPRLGGSFVKEEVPPNRTKPVAELGGFASFAKVWDVDEELNVFLRHRSVWHEWNSKLREVVPVLGED